MSRALASEPDSLGLVVGAGSHIAHELIKQLLSENLVGRVVAVSRGDDTELCRQFGERLQWLQCDYSDRSIREILARLAPESAQLRRVFICNGVLHNGQLFPEKRLEDFTLESFQQVLHVNTLIPVLWLKHLKALMDRKRDCVITVFSARVGSIDDNELGGWYSYRASKAALNMLLKNTAIEYSRLFKGTRFVVFHPGTTDTPLSKPF